MEEADAVIHALVLRKCAHEGDTRLKAHVERIAQEMGCTWHNIVMENRNLFLHAAHGDWDPDA